MTPGEYVVVDDRVAVVDRLVRHGRSDGAMVRPVWTRPGDDVCTVRFVAGWRVAAATVGVTVCREPVTFCYCSLVHVGEDLLAVLPQAPVRCGTRNTSGRRSGKRIRGV